VLLLSLKQQACLFPGQKPGEAIHYNWVCRIFLLLNGSEPRGNFACEGHAAANEFLTSHLGGLLRGSKDVGRWSG